MGLQITWFILWGVLWAVYFMLDGFVMGAGILHNLIGKSDGDKRVMINTIGPVWEGNEVWLVTAGGVTFAAFPTTYALMFSYLYSALFLLLCALIVRGVSYEFRSKEESLLWRKGWDTAIMVGNFLPALLFGVAFGNIFEGLPMDAAGYHGSLLSLLNPYGLLTGLLFVALFVVHGALYLAVKSTGELSKRSQATADKLWPGLLLVAVAFLVSTNFATKLYDNYLAHPLLVIVPLLAVVSLIAIRVLSAKGNPLAAFAASSLTILTVVATAVTGLFPNLIPSSIDPAYSLTLYNSSSSPYTLQIMLMVVAVFIPIIIGYKIWIYRIFRAPVREEEVLADKQAY
jgi:cytochrome bd ubiquinol oxidase subunit II